MRGKLRMSFLCAALIGQIVGAQDPENEVPDFGSVGNAIPVLQYAVNRVFKGAPIALQLLKRVSRKEDFNVWQAENVFNFATEVLPDVDNPQAAWNVTFQYAQNGDMQATQALFADGLDAALDVERDAHGLSVYLFRHASAETEEIAEEPEYSAMRDVQGKVFYTRRDNISFDEGYHKGDQEAFLALYQAGIASNRERFLINKDEDPEDPENIGFYLRDLLHIAATEGWFRYLAPIIQSGFDVNTEDEYGETALHEAARHGKLEAVQILLGQNADVDWEAHDHRTPLWLSLEGGNIEVVKTLIACGAIVTTNHEYFRKTIFDEALGCEHRARLIGMLLEEIAEEEEEEEAREANEREEAAEEDANQEVDYIIGAYMFQNPDLTVRLGLDEDPEAVGIGNRFLRFLAQMQAEG